MLTGFSSLLNGGGGCASLHATRKPVNINAVNPEEICKGTMTPRSCGLNPSMKNPKPRLKKISSAIA
jgi:hypothetical protein